MWPGLTQRLEGRLVVLEPLAPEHEAPLAEAARDPRTWRWMQTDGSRPERFRAWFERTLANAQASVSLAANGTYTVTIDPQGSCFGTHQFTLTH